MKDGIGIFLWKLSVALYLIANGALGLFVKKGLKTIGKSSDFEIIFGKMFKDGDVVKALVVCASVVAFVAGICVILEMLNVEISFLDTLILIIAIIWVVYVIFSVIVWVGDKFDPFWYTLQKLGVHVMVLASLMIASKKFG